MKLNVRTDLAVEAYDASVSPADEITKLEGVVARTRKTQVAEITDIEILNAVGARKIGKPVGRYITVSSSYFNSFTLEYQEQMIYAIADEVEKLLSGMRHNSILVIGLGNPAITPDSIGPEVVSKILVNRHIDAKSHESPQAQNTVASFAPGIPGMTGIESAETVKALVDLIAPDMVLIVDALATGTAARLCNTIQLTDTGIVPGSGVGNTKTKMNRETFGVPVIAIGVPTVIDARALVNDFLDASGVEPEKLPEWETYQALMVTPKDIDSAIKRMSRFLALAINTALHKSFSISDFEKILCY